MSVPCRPACLLVLLTACSGSSERLTEKSVSTVGDELDDDGDGDVLDDDCDDSNPEVHPDAPEQCDGIDNNCDGLIDDADPTVEGTTTGYADADADGYGDATRPVEACTLPSDAVDDDTDCDDSNPEVHPGASESWYDGLDADCAGDSDYDADGDGFDADAHGGTDCDDAVDTTYTGATEVWYDGVDADCTGDSDYDADGDGFDG